MNKIEYILSLSEHKTADVDNATAEALSGILDLDTYDPSNPGLLLGIDWTNRSRTQIRAGYYVGVRWLKEGSAAVCVKPKIEGIDITAMFMKCFNHADSRLRNELGRIYQIDFDSTFMPSADLSAILTPLLVGHFVSVVHSICRKGLMRDYVPVTENLNGKIKGKIDAPRTLSRNHAMGRYSSTVCRYQEFSTDCQANRILHTALEFCRRFMAGTVCDNEASTRINLILNDTENAFRHVGMANPHCRMPRLHINPFFEDYSEALRLAAMIFRRFGYSLDATDYEEGLLTPPFHINMPLLFELYVYALLKEAYGREVKYHVRTLGNEIDFMKTDERLIIDTKYITRWDTCTVHENVRQLAGYARNHRFRADLLHESERDMHILDCMVIYPSKNGRNAFDSKKNMLDNAASSEDYLKFHTVAIRLPQNID